jgi:hypothetical protein
MKEDVRKEIRKLIRARNDVDAAIASFERLEAQVRAEVERSGPVATAKFGTVVNIKRKPRPET